MLINGQRDRVLHEENARVRLFTYSIVNVVNNALHFCP